jgi:Holliday junction resolvase RusA-like endonuclease
MDFANLYKDDAQIEYYNALEDASGKTGVTMKIMQIMTSPVFNISN